LFFAIRAPLAGIPFTGTPFFPSDLSLTLMDVLIVAIGLPVGAALAAWIALHRVQISPLGVTRRVTPGPPRAYRLIPLVAGILELAYFTVVEPHTRPVVRRSLRCRLRADPRRPHLRGPVADHERCPPHRASGPAAGRPVRGPELADDPQAGFRAISGLVLALFVTSVSVGVITTLVASAGPASGTAAANTLVNCFWRDSAGQLVSSVPSVPAQHDQQSHAPAIGKCARGAAVGAIDCPLGNGFGRKQPSIRPYGRLLRLPQRRWRRCSPSARMDQRLRSKRRARS
jgi:hypothetical protein